MIVVTKQIIRDMLALETKGMSIDTLFNKIQKRVNYEYFDKNHVMTAILELQEASIVKYDLEVGTWKSLIRLV